MPCAPPMSRRCRRAHGDRRSAGRPRASTGAVSPGEAVRIFTGAPMPEGADTIVIQENADGGATGRRRSRRRGAGARTSGPPASISARARRCWRPASGSTPAASALAAAMGHADVPVRRRPRVAILATGDELVLPGDAAGAGPDRLLEQPCASPPWSQRRGGRAASISASPATTLEALEQASPAGARRRHPGHDRRRLGRRSRSRAARRWQRRGMTLDFWKIAHAAGQAADVRTPERRRACSGCPATRSRRCCAPGCS